MLLPLKFDSVVIMLFGFFIITIVIVLIILLCSHVEKKVALSRRIKQLIRHYFVSEGRSSLVECQKYGS